MPVTVVCGGQFGSEGKGKVAHYLAKKMNAAYVVRCGGSNSGHTVIDSLGTARIFRHLPTAAILPDIKLAIGAGSYIDIDVLLQEIEEAKITPERLIIDPHAVIIKQSYKEIESHTGLIKHIGSTGSGTGAAVIARIQRQSSLEFAKDHAALKPFARHVSNELRKVLARKARVIIEGTQGFGLSLLHSEYYPYVTSRDTTASSFVSEVGLSPLDVDDIALVIRLFPIRVAGNSGGLPNEITWDILTQEGGYDTKIVEKTSVTNRIRRIAKFDPTLVKHAIDINHPTKIFLNHVDYLDSNIKNNPILIEKILKNIEEQINYPIHFYGLSAEEIYERS